MPHQSYHYYKNIDPNWLSMVRWFPLPCVVLFGSTCLDRKIFYCWVWFDLTCLAPDYYYYYLWVYLFIIWYRAWIFVHLVLIISTQDFIHRWNSTKYSWDRLIVILTYSHGFLESMYFLFSCCLDSWYQHYECVKSTDTYLCANFSLNDCWFLSCFYLFTCFL